MDSNMMFLSQLVKKSDCEFEFQNHIFNFGKQKYSKFLSIEEMTKDIEKHLQKWDENRPTNSSDKSFLVFKRDF